MHVTGMFPPIATPFDEQGRLETRALAANIARWNETGLTGYVVAGSNGEGALLEPDEVAAAVRVVRHEARPEQQIIAGTGCQATAATLRLTQKCADAGAAAALVLPPFYYSTQMSEAVLLRHYTTLAEAAPIPILIYNMPAATHLNIAPETIARLAAHPNIIGAKDSAGNIAQIIDLVRLCPAEFDILVGNAGAFLAGVEAGAKGGILALANVAPRECVALLQHALAGQHAAAREAHHRLLPVARAVTTQFGVPGLKAALDLLGYYGGDPRPPLLPLSEAARAQVRQILEEAGLLPAP